MINENEWMTGQGKDYENLDLDAFKRLFYSMSQSYKLFWFRGILEGVRNGKSEQTFGEIVDRMIADAWYLVVTRHLRLGLVDSVERLVMALRLKTGLPGNAEENAILLALEKNSDSDIEKLRKRLIEFVPYRLLSPFMADGWNNWENYPMTIERINKDPRMIYTFGNEKALERTIHIRPEWVAYLQENLDQIIAWTDQNLVTYLQKQNPSRKVTYDDLQNPSGKVTYEEQGPQTAAEKDATKVAEPVTTPDVKGKGKKTLTPKQKLWRKIKREFPKKKLIGDIAIDDEEFKLLVQELINKHSLLMAQPELFEADEVFCVALVQFGIRYYKDGTFWRYVSERVNPTFFKTPHTIAFGNEFLRFMEAKGKLLNKDKKAVGNILLHGFVSDQKAPDMFNFLFSYYSIDLARDIDQLNKDAMNALVETIKANDGRKRTYNLVEHTADAVRLNERGCKIRLRRYLKQINEVFWNTQEYSTRSNNRLMKRFAEWANNDDESIKKERNDNSKYANRHKGGWRPYLKYDYQNDLFLLVLPARLVKSEEEPSVCWHVCCDSKEQPIPVSADEAVTGYLTKEKTVPLYPFDIFRGFDITLFCNDVQVAKWKITSDQIRFFDTNGDSVDSKSLRSGEMISFSASDYLPVSDALFNTENWGGLIRCSYQFEDGDLIFFPDKTVLSIGRKPSEGLMNRGRQCGVYGETDGKQAPVYATAPPLFARILPKSMNGTQLRVNNQYYRLFEGNQPLTGVLTFELQEKSPELGVHIALNQFGVKENGLYHVELDIPNDHKNRTYDFLLIDGMEYSFDEAPYIFVDTGVLCVPEKTGLMKLDEAKESKEEGQLRFAFDIPENDDWFRLSMNGIPVAFQIPKLSYRFQGEEAWRTKMQMSIWHKDLPDIVEIRYPADEITILLDEEGNESEDEEQHIRTYPWNIEKDCFVCDLHSFRSWLGKRVANRRLYIQLPEMQKPTRFLNIYTRNVFITAVLSADSNSDVIHGEFDIIGKAACYADLWFGEEKLFEKEHIIDKKISLQMDTTVPSGTYRVDVYESDSDENGFDEPDYELLASKTMELVNPYNLTGKHIEVTQLAWTNDENYLRLKRRYTLYDLKPMPQFGKGHYSGHMVVREREFGHYRDDYQAGVYIPDPEELSKGRLFWVDEKYDDEKEPFLYDTERHFIQKEEDRSISWVVRYKRYMVIGGKDYVYRIAFVDKPEDLDNWVAGERYAKNMRIIQKEKDEIAKKLLQQSDPLCKTITQLGFSVRTYNSLRRGGITTSTELYSAWQNGTIYKVRNLGRKSMEECIYKLRKAGYSL